jgi:hypothetical protein
MKPVVLRSIKQLGAVAALVLAFEASGSSSCTSATAYNPTVNPTGSKCNNQTCSSVTGGGCFPPQIQNSNYLCYPGTTQVSYEKCTFGSNNTCTASTEVVNATYGEEVPCS